MTQEMKYKLLIIKVFADLENVFPNKITKNATSILTTNCLIF